MQQGVGLRIQCQREIGRASTSAAVALEATLHRDRPDETRGTHTRALQVCFYNGTCELLDMLDVYQGPVAVDNL